MFAEIGPIFISTEPAPDTAKIREFPRRPDVAHLQARFGAAKRHEDPARIYRRQKWIRGIRLGATPVRPRPKAVCNVLRYKYPGRARVRQIFCAKASRWFVATPRLSWSLICANASRTASAGSGLKLANRTLH